MPTFSYPFNRNKVFLTDNCDNDQSSKIGKYTQKLCYMIIY